MRFFPLKNRLKRTQAAIKNPRAVSLVEVIIASFLLALLSVSATLMIINALSSNRVSRNKMIAINLAREGIELVRSVRDSNWIRYSAYPKCWNYLPYVDDLLFPPGTPLYCVGGDLKPLDLDYDDINGLFDTRYFADQEISGFLHAYTIEIDPRDFSIYMVRIDEHLDIRDGVISADDEFFQLCLEDLDSPEDDEGDIYLHNATVGTCHDSLFYREIRFQYYAPDGITESDEQDSDDAPILKVYSTVQWSEGHTTHQVQLITKLTNYID